LDENWYVLQAGGIFELKQTEKVKDVLFKNWVSNMKTRDIPHAYTSGEALDTTKTLRRRVIGV